MNAATFLQYFVTFLVGGGCGAAMYHAVLQKILAGLGNTMPFRGESAPWRNASVNVGR